MYRVSNVCPGEIANKRREYADNRAETISQQRSGSVPLNFFNRFIDAFRNLCSDVAPIEVFRPIGQTGDKAIYPCGKSFARRGPVELCQGAVDQL